MDDQEEEEQDTKRSKTKKKRVRGRGRGRSTFTKGDAVDVFDKATEQWFSAEVDRCLDGNKYGKPQHKQ